MIDPDLDRRDPALKWWVLAGLVFGLGLGAMLYL